MKRPPTKPEKPDTTVAKKRKVAGGKKRGVNKIDNREELEATEDNAVADLIDDKPPPKGTTTAHFVKFMNELLEIIDEDESMQGDYLVMNNAQIHKSQPMIRKIESKGYRVMYLPPYSPELNPIEQFWAIVKGKMKRE